MHSVAYNFTIPFW